MSEVTEESILEYLKSMKFKRTLLGVSKTDSLLKMRELHRMYQQLISTKQAAAGSKQHSEYEDKVAAVAKAFVDMQEKTSRMTLDAQKQAEQIIAGAKKQADEILRDAARSAEELLDRCRRELEQALERQLKEIREAEGRGSEITPVSEIGSVELEQQLKLLERKAAAGGAKDDLPFTP